MRIRSRAHLLAATIALGACESVAPAPHTQNTPEVKVSPLQAACADACDVLNELGCPEAERSANGDDCELVCMRASELRDMKLGCVAAATTMIDLRACGTVRCRR